MLLYRSVRILFAALLVISVACPPDSRAEALVPARPADSPPALILSFENQCTAGNREALTLRFRIAGVCVSVRFCAGVPSIFR